MADLLRTINTRRTEQTRPAGGATRRNSAGGYVFDAEPSQQLRRFLILGTASGSYYATPQALTEQNASMVLALVETDHALVLDTVLAVDAANAAMRRQPLLFTYAATCSIGTVEQRARALSHLPEVARNATALFTLASYIQQLRGWGPAVRSAIASWYLDREPNALAYQMIKYRQREGWTHADLLRLSHPALHTRSEVRRYKEQADAAGLDWRDLAHAGLSGRPAQTSALIRWATRDVLDPQLPDMVNAYITAKAIEGNPNAAAEWAALIHNHQLPWEALPDAALHHPAVWLALLDSGLPYTALMRQLPRLSRIFDDSGFPTPVLQLVAQMLRDPEHVTRSRVHPMQLLVAHATYASGRSARGFGSWPVDAGIVSALEDAFYLAFQNVEPTGKRMLLALDVSGSMTAPAGHDSGLTCMEASAAMAMAQLAVEPNCSVVAFSANRPGWHASFDDPALTQIAWDRNVRLQDAIRQLSNLSFGRTDCALPIMWALQRRAVVDTFVVYTDNESYAGPIHVHQALRMYREQINPQARLVVVAMAANSFSVADPSDPLSLDVVGFDPSVPSVISTFSRGL